MTLIETRHGEIWIRDYRKDNHTSHPTLFVHGAGGTHMDWPVQLRRMPEAGSIAFDLPGHGQSPGTGYDTIEDYARALIELLDALSLEQVILAGHSMGGAITQWVALKYPERVNGLILVATGARLPVNPAIIEGIVSDPQTTAIMLTKWMWSKTASDDLRAMMIKQLMNTDPVVTQRDYIACNNFDVRDKLTEILCPTLVIAGDQDKMTPLDWNKTLAETIPQGMLKIVEGGSHMLMLEQPAIVASMVKAWLTNHKD